MNSRGSARILLALLHDASVAAASFVAALYLRLGTAQFFDYTRPFLLSYTLIFTGVAMAVFLFSGLHRRLWRYASAGDLIAIAKAATLAIGAFFLVLFLLSRLEGIPRSVPVIQWFLLVAMLGGTRLLYRLFQDRRAGREAGQNIPVLLVGATPGAELFLREVARNPASGYRVVGMIDDDPARIGREMHGIPILGNLATLPAAVKTLARKTLRPQRVIVTDDRLQGEALRALFDAADALGIPLARLPRLTEFKQGISEKPELRPIAVEDLLGRAQHVHDREGMRRMIQGASVMVTGAGGSIGAELCRQIAALAPARLVLFELSEYALYRIDLELSESFPSLERVATLGDVCDRAQVARALALYRPDLVFHAAAIKHVPLAEANPAAAVLTNVEGTKHVAEACASSGVRAMVMISTDKAVNPTNVMGATKRVAEMVVQAAGNQGSTRFLTVRFGNVLGSTGSVVPLFQRQIAQGGPVTVTHPEMTRFFMTIREAVELVLQAAALETALPAARLVVLDMGAPVKILDLAEQMIRLAGLRPHEDIKIVFTGLRPGEKMHEELFHPSETASNTAHESLLLASPRAVDPAALAAQLAALEASRKAGDDAALLSALRALVPEFAS